jgi:hypothetical protein
MGERTFPMFNESELKFLADNGLAPGDVIDGRRLSKNEREAQAKALGKALILATPCAKGGHRLRTRSGHCAQCNTAVIRYQARHREAATVYVAYSPREALTKIGVSVDPDTREANINFDQYAGADDWEILFRIDIPEAGMIESKAQSAIAGSKVIKGYMKDRAFMQDAKEAFSCSPLEAINAIIDAISQSGQSPEKPWANRALIEKYSKSHDRRDKDQ